MLVTHNKKTNFRLWVYTLGSTLLFFVLLMVYLLLSPLYLPLSISVRGIDSIACTPIRFIGEKPLTGEYTIPFKDSAWQGGAALYKEIRVEIPEGLNTDSLQIIIENGDFISTYSIDDLTAINTTGNRIRSYHFVPPIKSPGNFWQKTGSILSKKLLHYCAIVFGFWLLFLIFRKSLRRFWLAAGKLKNHTSVLLQHIISDKKHLRIFYLATSVIVSIVFCFAVEFTDRAGTPRNPDSYDYQCIAVNFAVGNEFPTSGTTYPIETYKFILPDKQIVDRLARTAGLASLHRAPVFGLFCGLVYKTVGIHPVVVKYLLLILLCFTGIFLCYLGSVIFGKNGFIIGLIAGLIFISLNYQLADRLIPGGIFISAWVIFSFYATYRYFEKPGAGRIVVMGILFASSWLVTFSMILIPVFIFLWLIYNSFRRKKILIHLCLFVLSMSMVLLPWQIFVNRSYDQLQSRLIAIQQLAMDTTRASSEKRIEAAGLLPGFGPRFIPDSNFEMQELHTLKTVILPRTNQNGYYPDPEYSENINKMAFLEDMLHSSDLIFLFLPKPSSELLSCHNELMQKGMIAQDWRIRDSFYSRQDTTMKSELSRVFDFYRHYPAKIFILSKDKIIAAFGPYKEVLAILALWAGLLFLKLTQKRTSKGSISNRRIAAFAIPFIVLIGLYLSPWFYAVLFVIFVCSLIINPQLMPSSIFERLCGLYILNYVVTVLISFGIDRYIQPLQFLLLLLAVGLHFLFISKFIELMKPKKTNVSD